MKIFFIGTVEFSKNALAKLLELNAEIVGVATKSKSKFNADFADLTPLCENKNIPYKFIKDINSENNIAWIKSLNPDIVFCFGWSSLIKKELLNLTPMGVLGFHPAALPANRGRHPLIWALVLGLKKTASTFFFMDKGADSGDILSQKEILIDEQDDAQVLYDKMTEIALIQIKDFLPTLQNHFEKKTPKKQYASPQNHQKANYWRKRGRQDGHIDFRMNSQNIYNLVRALTKPYVGAHVFYQEQDIKVWKAKPIEFKAKNIEFGKIVSVKKDTFIVKTADGAIEILEHEFEKIPEIGTYL